LPAPLALAAQRDPPSARRIRVIVADDSKRTRHALCSLLATYGDLEIAGQAEDGEEAVQLIERERPDVAILDVHMPRLDGLQATARIKASNPDVRILVLSLAAELRDQAMALGADAFVTKGSSQEHLLRAIRSLGSSR
jgi:DNA-binding NarL/FixJ family response regulator